MNWNDYTNNEIFRFKSTSYDQVKPDLAHGIIGIASEAGELIDLLKKLHFHPHKQIGRDQIIDEIGDLMWYVRLTLGSIGATLEEALDKNVAKLSVRYEKNSGNKDREAEALAQASV